jgi:hypothetical protein
VLAVKAAGKEIVMAHYEGWLPGGQIEQLVTVDNWITVCGGKMTGWGIAASMA